MKPRDIRNGILTLAGCIVVEGFFLWAVIEWGLGKR